eukprot:8482708-Lingulodinium_polyedra.AAC.1
MGLRAPPTDALGCCGVCTVARVFFGYPVQCGAPPLPCLPTAGPGEGTRKSCYWQTLESVCCRA